MDKSETLSWTCRDRILELGSKTRIMGILNITPDSFFDGGRHDRLEKAIEHGCRLAADGADIIDVGGESTRPGADPVGLDQELERVVPVVEALVDKTDRLISIDTMKAAVAREALSAGAHIINDVSALTADAEMPEVARAFGAGVVLMHMQGEPGTMQQNPVYENVGDEIRDYLERRIAQAVAQGLDASTLAIDPGIGFGKTTDHNIELIQRLDLLKRCGAPILVGHSRKRFLGDLTGRDTEGRLGAGLGVMAFAIMKGAHIFRVHDVKESCDVACIMDRMLQESAQHESIP